MAALHPVEIDPRLLLQEVLFLLLIQHLELVVFVFIEDELSNDPALLPVAGDAMSHEERILNC